MPEESVNLEYRGNIAIVTINRPAKRNAFNAALFSHLEAVTRRLQANLPRVVILTGAGEKAFCAGFDVHPDNPLSVNLLKSAENNDEAAAQKVVGRVREVVDGLIALPVPIIAALNGQAYGGGAETAVRCDLRVMDPAAVICFSETRLGLIPDFGGGPGLVRLVGPSIAADLILTARPVSADEALTLKIVNRISAPGQALAEAMALGETIAANGPRAVQAALAVIRRSPDLSMKEALALEFEKAVSLIATGEFMHGVSAFFEKKTPVFPD
ncbi:MAG: enoyl-CoA hydratase/isomerase family protein [bacterium]